MSSCTTNSGLYTFLRARVCIISNYICTSKQDSQLSNGNLLKTVRTLHAFERKHKLMRFVPYRCHGDDVQLKLLLSRDIGVICLFFVGNFNVQTLIILISLYKYIMFNISCFCYFRARPLRSKQVLITRDKAIASFALLGLFPSVTTFQLC